MHRRVPEPDTDDEVGRLARTMNAMLDRLETSSQKQRQFVSDASHELRSPLASIRTNLEVALRNADRTDWPEVADRALAEDERMEDTVERAARAGPARRGHRPGAASTRCPRSTSTSSCSTTPSQHAPRARRHHAGAPPDACTVGASSSTRVVRNLRRQRGPPRDARRSRSSSTTDGDVRRARRRRRRARHPARGPRAGVRPLHPPRRRPGTRRRRPGPRPRDGEGDRRAATAARSPWRTRPSAGPASRVRLPAA